MRQPYSLPEMQRADAVLYGRTTYEMMESAWRRPESGVWPDRMDEWEIPFAEALDRMPKFVVSRTLDAVDWNAELVRGDLAQEVQQLKQQTGEGLSVGGVALPLRSPLVRGGVCGDGVAAAPSAPRDALHF